ncbi:transketolase [Candidatus Woesebacteria bacterium RIFOXYA1_FULL_40_18]|uniref:Transketolase domain protein n=3 Tax=Candidatus Woeseibacteriota TaxID=1752722 RepID=A0A0G0SK70_9BACT|nr:MAG: Transketolase domain protein [Candidatus Woesebacteria bacterium GW2011_GWA1_40_45]OGM76501.1 MAG: transketolase [Candidatus Woesebacteria bacterium RIFOXYA1_FULL_40_18]OGM80336.1 MAG: transketolase [Candidatus Woesebacteria bacterium RIFOXYB1_FULL_40_26]
MKHSVQELEKIANDVRKDIIKMLVAAGSGHSAGSLGMADVFVALYFGIMNHDPANPAWPERDRLILSNGHICPVRYVTMAHAGCFPISELKTLRKLGTRLQGHPERLRLPGLETTSGPLGSGLGQASGYAYAARMDGKRFRVYCVTSDGEHDEGNHWEAVAFAGKYKLSNLTCIVDRNNIQIDGYTEDVMPLEPLEEKYKAFNWHTLHIDGHNFEEITNAVNHARSVYEKPTVIIAHTIPGKGVSYMENDFKWHGTPPGITDMPGEPPKEEQVKQALHDLRTLGGKIRSEHE